MRYLVSRMVHDRWSDLAAFKSRYQAERYAERESGLSGYICRVEDSGESPSSPVRYLSVFNDGKTVFSHSSEVRSTFLLALSRHSPNRSQ